MNQKINPNFQAELKNVIKNPLRPVAGRHRSTPSPTLTTNPTDNLGYTPPTPQLSQKINDKFDEIKYRDKDHRRSGRTRYLSLVNEYKLRNRKLIKTYFLVHYTKRKRIIQSKIIKYFVQHQMELRILVHLVSRRFLVVLVLGLEKLQNHYLVQFKRRPLVKKNLLKHQQSLLK